MVEMGIMTVLLRLLRHRVVQLLVRRRIGREGRGTGRRRTIRKTKGIEKDQFEFNEREQKELTKVDYLLDRFEHQLKEVERKDHKADTSMLDSSRIVVVEPDLPATDTHTESERQYSRFRSRYSGDP